MKATTWHGSGIYGIRVGYANRDTYFDTSWSEVEVEIDGQFHTFRLTKGFWNKCPEIRDRGTPIFKQWLQKHKTLKWPYRQPPAMQLLPLEGKKFRLAP